jgi:hypothetical protein
MKTSLQGAAKQTADSHLYGTRFGHQLFSLRFILVCLNRSRTMLGQFLKIYEGHSFLILSIKAINNAHTHELG